MWGRHASAALGALIAAAGCSQGSAVATEVDGAVVGDGGEVDAGPVTMRPDASVPTTPCDSDERGCFDRPIALGEMFACGIRGNQRVACWGSGQWGALGLGAETDHSEPVEISSLSGVVQVTAGYKHACALLATGQVRCWGYNSFNQLGTGSETGPDTCDDGGTTSSVRCSKVPVPVEGLPAEIVQVEAGKFYTCALSAAGEMYCWGSPQDGVLGNGMTTGPFSAPVAATLANDEGTIDMLAPGARHNCVLLASGTDRVRCWGFQGNGRLGNGSLVSEVVVTPQTVVQPNVGFLSSGEAQSCVVLTNGAVRCWGSNANHELGNDTTESSSAPTDVLDAASAIRVSVEIGDSLGHVVAATAAGGAQCWGRNLSGECGLATATDPVTRATDVAGLTGVAHVGTGTYHSCAMLTDGAVRCWGMRTRCQMGDGDCGPGTQSTLVTVSNFP
jgi:alpha-tubulin suppressor-like RCC1 family protein